MKKLITVPDRTLKLSHGDKVDIFVEKNKVIFHFDCDGTGNTFSLNKQEMLDLLLQNEKEIRYLEETE